MLIDFPEIPGDFVPGRISRPEFFDFWEKVLKPGDEILSIIRDGYRVPFVNSVLPLPSCEPNNQSALRESTFLLQELFRWEKIGCTSRSDSKPRIVLPVSVGDRCEQGDQPIRGQELCCSGAALVDRVLCAER